MFSHALYLDQFFEQQLRKWLPAYTIGQTVAAAAAAVAASADIGTSASAAVAALRGGADGDTQTFGDGSVVIGMKRSRPNAMNNDSAEQLL